MLEDAGVYPQVKLALAEKAGRWFRVSTDQQDEESQYPDVDGWIETNEYVVPEGCTYVVHGGSARRPNRKFKQAWAQVLEDFRTGKIDVLVVWKLNRLDRKLKAMQMLAEVFELGGRVEFVKQPHLNDLTTMAGRVMLTLEMELAHQDSEDKSENVAKDLAKRRVNGSVVGKPSWGARIGCRECGQPVPKKTVCHSGIKLMYWLQVAVKYIPLIFDRVIAGESLTTITQWLDSEGVKTTTGRPWSEAYLGRDIIRNPAYYGHRRNSGNLKLVPLVTKTVWDEANAALDTRLKSGRGATVHEEVLFTPVCANPKCNATGEHPSPMYRVYGGNNGKRYEYYKCTGRGPKRHGCGAALPPIERVEAEVDKWMAAETRMHYEWKFIAGDDIANRIAEEQQKGADLMKVGDLDGATESMRVIKALRNSNKKRVRPHWEPKETNKTIGQHWASLNRAQRRIYLAEGWIIAAYLSPDGVLTVWCAGREKMAPV